MLIGCVVCLFVSLCVCMSVILHTRGRNSCYLAKAKYVDRLRCVSVCLIVWLDVCQSLTGHNFKLIFTKLHHMVEFVISKKPIVFEEDLHFSSMN